MSEPYVRVTVVMENLATGEKTITTFAKVISPKLSMTPQLDELRLRPDDISFIRSPVRSIRFRLTGEAFRGEDTGRIYSVLVKPQNTIPGVW